MQTGRGAGLTTADDDPGRSAAADLHLLPSRARARRAGRADAAHAGRPRDRRDRARVSRAAARRWRSGWCGRSARSATRGIPYVVPDTNDMPAAARCRADGDLSRLQRRLRGHPGRAARADRSVRRGDPARPPGATLMAPQPPAEATALLALMLLHDSRRDARLDEAGDLVLLEEQDRSRWDRRADRRGAAAGRGGASRRARSVRAAGGDRGAALPGGARRGHRLAADRPALRSARARAALADRDAEPRGGGGDGRRPERGACASWMRIAREGDLDEYHLLHATRADLLLRLGADGRGRDRATRARWR